MTITLTKKFVRDVLKFCPKGRRRAETCRDVSSGYRALAQNGGALASDHKRKAAEYTELADRLDANAAQRSTDPQHQHQLWNS